MSDIVDQDQHRACVPSSPAIAVQRTGVVEIALLTGGRDKPYALGMGSGLSSQGIYLDFIGSDDLSSQELLDDVRVRFLNLRGDQRSNVSFSKKALRVASYYTRLICYAATSKPKIFHVLWTNKFDLFDRTVLMLYYKLLGKRIVLTAHNVNAGERDSNDTWLNRLSLKIQYWLTNHIFVHTKRMKSQLVAEFGVPEQKVSVIPFGINNTVPNTTLTTREAKRRLGLNGSHRTLLFFGNIAPYKGLEYLIAAFTGLSAKEGSYRLIIAGRPKGCENHWEVIKQKIIQSGTGDRIIQRIEYVPDEETELYFKAADVLVLPYTHVFQSGVLFLGYSFGLPVIAADVGSLKEEIIEGETGFIFEAKASADLENTIVRYFESNLYRDLDRRRPAIRDYANDRYSWTKVGEITKRVYTTLLTP